MKITLDTTKSVYENVSDYFAKAKRAKQKQEKVHEVIADTQKKLNKLVKEKAEYLEKVDVQLARDEEHNSRKIEWFEKFRWFYTSNGMLAIGGRDATTNEIVLKKHTDDHDYVFHTEMPGSPFFILKTEGHDVPPQVFEEVAQVTACYSKAWKAGYASVPVFYVKPDQVSKHANSGEFIGKGSFMIRGEKTFLHPAVQLSVGVEESGRICVGTKLSLRNRSTKQVTLLSGREKPSQIAKNLVKQFDISDSNEVLKHLPSGGIRIVKK